MKETQSITRSKGFLPGLIIGVLWVAMAAIALQSAARGYANSRLDWGLGWGLVGVLLLAAGLAAIVGSWWHNYRVKRPH